MSERLVGMDERIVARVEDFLGSLASSPVSREVLGVVVSGSAARQEEIWDGDRLISDIDLMVLTRRTSPRLIGQIEQLIGLHRDQGIDGGQVPLGPLARYLTFAFFEARANGIVVQGGVDLAALIPPTDAASLPVWEGVRVLANRLVEHVKYAEGLVEADRVVAKSYEALAEAYLVAEGRYRPSYAERLAEVTARPLAAPPAVTAQVAAVLRARLGHGPLPPVSVPQARADLVAGLGQVAGLYTGRPGGAAEQLAALARGERHWRHRLYWAALMAKQRRRPDVAADPIIRIWQRTLALVTGPASAGERRALLGDWRACPQILVRRAA